MCKDVFSNSELTVPGEDKGDLLQCNSHEKEGKPRVSRWVQDHLWSLYTNIFVHVGISMGSNP